MKGKLISIEGIEGAGKSTAVEFIKTFLSKHNKPVFMTREPGGTWIAEKIRDLLLHHDAEKIYPETELLLLFAARVQHIQEKIKPALNAGEWVICDRYIDASYAYQGGGRKIPEPHIRYLDQWLVGKIYPDLTILLDVSPQIGEVRTQKRGGKKDRIEQEKSNFFALIRENYLKRAQISPNRIQIVDASLPLADVKAKIQYILEKFLSEYA